MTNLGCEPQRPGSRVKAKVLETVDLNFVPTEHK